MSIRAVIVDDELPICSEIEYLLQAHPDILVAAKFDQSQQALAYIQENPCELIFLDIHMPGMGGLEFANCLRTLGLRTLVVFVTAYEEYALPAFATPAVGYITKPITQAHLTQALMKVRSLLQVSASISSPAAVPPTASKGTILRPERISVRQGNVLIPLCQPDILLAYVKDKDVFLHTKADDFLLSMTLSELIELLDAANFLRVHRQYIVNLNAIEKIIPWFHGTYMLRLKDASGTEIPVSRTHIQELRRALGIR
jgi:DNA-binding LytR/AlgR family response regulator